VGVKHRPHPPRELRRSLFDVPPRRHAPMIARITGGAWRSSAPLRVDSESLGGGLSI
jgi:hypothetical protein